MRSRKMKVIRYVALGLLFAVLMTVNLKVGLTSSSHPGTAGLSLLGLSLQLSVPTAVACDGGPAGTCCPEDGSYCVIGDVVIFDAYYNGIGPCHSE